MFFNFCYLLSIYIYILYIIDLFSKINKNVRQYYNKFVIIKKKKFKYNAVLIIMILIISFYSFFIAFCCWIDNLRSIRILVFLYIKYQIWKVIFIFIIFKNLLFKMLHNLFPKLEIISVWSVQGKQKINKIK